MRIPSGDIHDQSRKLSKIAKNFGQFFCPRKFVGANTIPFEENIRKPQVDFLTHCHVIAVARGHCRAVVAAFVGAGLPKIVPSLSIPPCGTSTEKCFVGILPVARKLLRVTR